MIFDVLVNKIYFSLVKEHLIIYSYYQFNLLRTNTNLNHPF